VLIGVVADETDSGQLAAWVGVTGAR
jgi:hypothetical protein